jgi:hypothetical protein
LCVVREYRLGSAGGLSPGKSGQQKKQYPHAVDLTIDPSASL